MTRIALLATGGTIACRQTEHGLTPALTGAELIRGIPMSRDAELVSRDVFSMDSSNIQPEEWAQLARAIDQSFQDCDGVVVTHGTDTMGYTAAAGTEKARDSHRQSASAGSAAVRRGEQSFLRH